MKMAIEYGFGRYAPEDKKAFWQKKFEALSDKDREFFHGGLDVFLVICGIPHISPKTIPEFVNRALDRRLFNERFLMDLRLEMKQAHNEEALSKYLERFIGFEANVSFETTKEWVDRHYKWFIRNSMFKTEKDIRAEHDHYIAYKTAMENGQVFDEKAYYKGLNKKGVK